MKNIYKFKKTFIFFILTLIGVKVLGQAVTTDNVNTITSSTAYVAATVTSVGPGITQRGICYNTTGTPTISDSVRVDPGTGLGSYELQIINLTSPTTYYVRAYVISDGYTAATPTIHNVIVDPLPGPASTISGTSSLCAGTQGIVYSVAPIENSVYYVWTLPPGATIVSGIGTNSITVDFASNATSGDITVYGNNICGNGQTSPDFEVMVNPIPSAPEISSVADTLYSNAPIGNQWYYNGNPVAGGTEQTLVAQYSGWYWDVVTLVGCNSDTSSHIYLTVTGIKSTFDMALYTIFPVPNDGIFTARIITPHEQTFSILIYDQIGIKIFESKSLTVNGTYQKIIDLRPTPNGVYTVVFRNNDHDAIRKILINK